MALLGIYLGVYFESWPHFHFWVHPEVTKMPKMPNYPFFLNLCGWLPREMALIPSISISGIFLGRIFQKLASF